METIRKITLAIMIIASLLLLVAGAGALTMGIRYGLLPFCAGALLLTISLALNSLRSRFPRFYKAAYGIIAGAVTLAVVISIIASAQILARYFDEEPPGGAVMIVLGCGLSPVDHTSPSLMLGRRLAVAYGYLSAHPDTICVVSGGQGLNENISEARAMADYLTRRGIGSERVYLEDESTSTNENIAFSRRLLIEEGVITADGVRDLIVVTDAFHQFRAQRIASQYGFNCFTLSSHAPFSLVCYFWLREIGGVVTQVWL